MPEPQIVESTPASAPGGVEGGKYVCGIVRSERQRDDALKLEKAD